MMDLCSADGTETYSLVHHPLTGNRLVTTTAITCTPRRHGRLGSFGHGDVA